MIALLFKYENFNLSIFLYIKTDTMNNANGKMTILLPYSIL